ncbi:MerR family transcriptional regulator [Youngiibacter fragilis]|uniref:MerR family transcriptional regulator n=1 Tax=Youngiibacter fragilis 232.1 TaxID=994573 RepID=V7I0S7_9CLOT|nr:MerR family transcriptional regulator [Youngiibacter fragilis]ETA79478.1 MerR family transcriptional regulator [Youngiibacter fragilis 232.1]
MKYTISQAAEKMGVAASALRYYDKEGLLPFMEKKPAGTRVFSEKDLQRLNMINCMKSSGMPIKDIRKYFDLCREGDRTLSERLEMFLERKEIVRRQIEELDSVMDTIERKIRYYHEAIEAGTEAIHDNGMLADA